MTKQKLEQIRDVIIILENLSDEDWKELFEMIEDPCWNSKILKNNIEEQKNLNKKVKSLLRKLGVQANFRGYEYLSYAIILYMQTEKSIRFGKDIYPAVAKRFKEKPSAVARNIDYAIEIACDNTYDVKLYTEIFGDVTKFKIGKPSSGQFIALVAEYIKNN